MTEIIFRGKNIKDGSWLYGCLMQVFDNSNKSYHPEIVESLDLDSFTWNEVIPEAVGQFTGLTDKNGVKVFEGDKINYVFDGVIFHNTGDFVCFQNGYFGISRPNKNTKYIPVICDAKNIEVIGNIHDGEVQQ